MYRIFRSQLPRSISPGSWFWFGLCYFTSSSLIHFCYFVFIPYLKMCQTGPLDLACFFRNISIILRQEFSVANVEHISSLPFVT